MRIIDDEKEFKDIFLTTRTIISTFSPLSKKALIPKEKSYDFFLIENSTMDPGVEIRTGTFNSFPACTATSLSEKNPSLAE